MKKLALIGGKDLKKYTIADILWKNISEVSGVKFDFDIYELEDINSLRSFFADFKKYGDFIGFNVATPWKTESSKIGVPINDDVCAKNGIINTVFKDGGGIFTANTDPLGIIKSYRSRFSSLPKEILIIGAGNAGTSLALKLLSEGCNVHVYDIQKIEKLYKEIIYKNSYADILNNKYDWIINASTVGKYYFDRAVSSFCSPISSVHIRDIASESCVFQEMNYLPVKTELLRISENYGYTVISGVEMLIYQGITSFELYTGKILDRDQIKLLISVMNKYAEDVEKAIFERNTQ